MNNPLLKPILAFTGGAISRVPLLYSVYRNHNFRGKQLLSNYISLPKESGIYDVNGLKYELDFQDEIQQAIFLGTYERDDLAFLKGIVAKGDICLDIGANVGFYSVNLNRLAPLGKVFSIEADSNNFKRLQTNLQLNNMRTDRAENIAISSKAGTATFSRTLERNSGWGRLGEWKAASETIKVNTTTLDDFLATHEIEKIDFLKIDIEGHELEFLVGGQQSLANGKVRKMLIEYSGYVLEPRGITLRDYVKAIEDLGFRPKDLELKRIASAKAGKYTGERRTMNLYFEWDG
ncbi:FkbM family methyltransferase [Planctomycetaceae bacterium SH139]